MTSSSHKIADNTSIVSSDLDKLFGLLNSVHGKSRAKVLNTICEKLTMTCETSPSILKVMLVWPHWYSVLLIDPARTVRHAARKVHSVLRLLIRPMNPETKKLSGPWIAWCYWSLNKNAQTFVQEAFKIIYHPHQNSLLDPYHKDLVDTLHFNLQSPNQ